TLGVYAVTTYGIARRRREMNIRVALGARHRQVMLMVVRQGCAPIAAGIGAGTLAALAAGRLVASLLFEVPPRDPAIITAAVAAVAGVAALACVLAARQTLSIQPAAALRDE